MRTYRDLDPANLRGVVFDIDDTVTRHGVLEPQAYAAMHLLADAGFDLVAVTGRPLGWTDVVARMWPVRLAVGENGAGWSWTDGPVMHEGYFAGEREREGHTRMLDAIRHEVSLRMPQVRVTHDHRARRCDLAFDIGEEVTLPRADIDALVTLIEELGARSSVSTVHAHAIPGEWDKASGVSKALSEALGISLADELDRWLFVGDSGNDAAAFTCFPQSVGVANVRDYLDCLPIRPRYITDADRGMGFAELASHLVDSRG